MDGKLAELLARRRAAQEDSEREERGLYSNDALDVQHGGVLASTAAGEQVKRASQFSSPGGNTPPSIQLKANTPSAAAKDASPQASQPEPAQPTPPPKKPSGGAMPKLGKTPAGAPGLGAYAGMSPGNAPAKSAPPQAPAAGAAGGSSMGASPSKPPPSVKAPAAQSPPAAAQSPPAAPAPSIAQAPGFGAYAGRSPGASPPAAPASGGGPPPAAPQSGVLLLTNVAPSLPGLCCTVPVQPLAGSVNNRGSLGVRPRLIVRSAPAEARALPPSPPRTSAPVTSCGSCELPP